MGELRSAASLGSREDAALAFDLVIPELPNALTVSKDCWCQSPC